METPDIKINKILYATDLSDGARYAFAYATNLANTYGAHIVILHVMTDTPSLDADVSGYIGEERWQEIKQKNFQETRAMLIGKKRDNSAIREALLEFCENTKSKYENQSFDMDEIIVEKGNPVEHIIRLSNEKTCDVIVIGSRGHGSFSGTFIGSTAQRVIRKSSKPVFVVPLLGRD